MSQIGKLKCKNLQARIYRNPKQEYKFENYVQIKEKKHEAALTKLRISAHKLHIETRRYKIYDKDLKKYTDIPKDKRRYQTCLNEVELYKQSPERISISRQLVF